MKTPCWQTFSVECFERFANWACKCETEFLVLKMTSHWGNFILHNFIWIYTNSLIIQRPDFECHIEFTCNVIYKMIIVTIKTIVQTTMYMLINLQMNILKCISRDRQVLHDTNLKATISCLFWQ